MRFSRPLAAMAIAAMAFTGCGSSSTSSPSASPSGAARSGTPAASAAKGLTVYMSRRGFTWAIRLKYLGVELRRRSQPA